VKTLDVERIFSDPALSGQVPSQVLFSPDASMVTYLAAPEDNRERLDLYGYNLAAGTRRRLIDAGALGDDNGILSDAEKAERERKRFFSTGISNYAWHPVDPRLLVVMGGTAFLFDLTEAHMQRITPPGTRQTDVRFSATGRFVSYVRGGDLYAFDTDTASERQLTDDGGDHLTNGVADFIAQEEMHRFAGYWWSPDDGALAFTRVDASTVAVSHRIEIEADQSKSYPQRYPYAGATNASVQLGLITLATDERCWIDYADDAEDYLARVAFAADEVLTVVQSRDQQRVCLKRHCTQSNASAVLLEETARTWVNLHDNLTFIDGSRDFLWASERHGIAQLFRYTAGDVRCLTPDRLRVERVARADANVAYFMGWDEDPTQQHLFRIDLDGVAQPTALTVTPGWHDCEVATTGTWFADRYSTPGQPPSLFLHSLETGERLELAGNHLDAGHPYAPYLDAHVTPSFGVLAAGDGQTMHYRLTPPLNLDETRQYPAIVQVYGGPGVQRVRQEWGALTTQLFAQAGFAVLEVDNRGSGYREKRFEDPIYECLGVVEVEDQVIASRWLAELPWIDGGRIGVFGHSYGGFMTLMCMAKAADVFGAGVAVAPVTDWALYDTHYTERYLRTPQENPDGYTQSGVLAHLAGISGALLVIHGMADDNVLFTNSTKLFKALQDRQMPFEMMTYPGAKHALQERSVAIHRFTTILAFFERHLGVC
jgi:dipeptidyl-peptidase-4